MQEEKLIIVEGGADRKRLMRILAEPVKILCTNGTISSYHLEELLTPYEEWQMFVFMDADGDGEKNRTLFKQDYPTAIHLYTEEMYKEVETTPYNVLASILQAAHIAVHSQYLE